MLMQKHPLPFCLQRIIVDLALTGCHSTIEWLRSRTPANPLNLIRLIPAEGLDAARFIDNGAQSFK
ncbi:hypothetical protein CEV32_1576 [Brucella rhizosphaerae]|uniref:Uncharacterized protein n=1 Tax=Brucella rhizosphaerae TaxID=571254 RepID=A0A256F906_9HYPH|nr:hypothetical protein CEV32_1576 [Brucella rhizosphaerae]